MKYVEYESIFPLPPVFIKYFYRLMMFYFPPLLRHLVADPHQAHAVRITVEPEENCGSKRISRWARQV